MDPDPGTGTTATDTGAAATDSGTSGTPDYEAMYKATQVEAEKWKSLSRKHEKQAKDNHELATSAAGQQENLSKVLAALGIDTGNKTPDVQEITTKLQAAQAAERSRAVELAVLRAAGRAGADGDALLDSRSFLDGLKDVDPADATAITDAVKAAVTANSRYALGMTATDGQGTTTTAPAQRQASSTADFNGAPGGNRQWTQTDVDRATPAQLLKAIEDGLVKQHLAS
jgi:hypothetical protein